MAPLNASYKRSIFAWTDECRECLQELRSRVRAAPRIPCRPEAPMKEGRGMVINKSDGSNVRVGACLLLVKCGNDGETTPKMMLDPNRVSLLSVDSKGLSAGVVDI